jgi:hypothetical protein
MQLKWPACQERNETLEYLLCSTMFLLNSAMMPTPLVFLKVSCGWQKEEDSEFL